MKRFLTAIAAALGAGAHAAFFNFEELNTGFFGSGTVAVNNGGVTATLTTEGFPGGFIYVADRSVQTPSFQHRSVLGSQIPNLESNRYTPVRITFSTALNFVSVQMADGGGDDDGDGVMRVYDAGDNLLGTRTLDAGSGANVTTLALNAANISYIVVSTTGADPNSIFLDNLSAEPVPEPATLAALGFGLAVLARRRKRES